MDPSNGYEWHFDQFVALRENHSSQIGYQTVLDWAQKLPIHSTVLDLGCGTGKPITKALMDAELKVFAIDASAKMVDRFQQNFPQIPICKESALDSTFFDQTFDAIVAWGLIFLLGEDQQKTLLELVSSKLNPKGTFLFTSPMQKVTWRDSVTGLESISMGREGYVDLCKNLGLILDSEYVDEGENHYYSFKKSPISKA
jgi:SAM-dependent methyltransferase